MECYDSHLLSLKLLSIAMGALLLFSTFASAWAILVYWLSPVIKKTKLKRAGFDGPPPMFPLGNLLEMRKKGTNMASPAMGSLAITHDFHSIVFPYFSRWRKLYGKVFVYWLGTEPFLYVAEPEFLRKVTSGALGRSWGKPEVFKKDRMPMFGNGLVMAEGDDWVRHRNIIAPALLSMSILDGIIKLMVESTSKMLDDWSRHLASGTPQMDVERDVSRNASEIIAKAIFGVSDDNGKQVFEKLKAMQAMLFKSNRLVGVPFSKLLQLKKTQEAWRLGIEIDELLLSIIDSRKKQECTNLQKDLLTVLLAGRDRFTSEELVDECKTFFFGGHETTALAVTWTLLMLATYPEWQQILRKEIMEVCGEGSLDSSILSKLTKMGWVFNEVTRLYSPAPNAQRQAREDIRIGDTVVPKGTNMWIDVVGLHHDRDLWGEDVNEFKPERFKDSIYGGCEHRMGFLPFGFGGRICVGRSLAVMEYKIVLSLILRRFSLRVSPGYLHCPVSMLSLRPSHGLPLILEA